MTDTSRQHLAGQAEQASLLQSERMAAMSKLAAGVAHEINNPTGVLLMKLKFLLSVADQEALSERAVSTLQVAVEQTERIEMIVENLLNFSRVSETTPRAVDVNMVGAAAVAQQHVTEAGPKLTWQPGDGSLTVLADAGELQQVFSHLLDNATYAAGSEGQVDVHTSLKDDRITFVVCDDGQGIPDDFRPRIFDPFFTTRPVGEGTGLGLAIAWGIVQRCGGSIDVHSVRRQGTTMTVNLPAVAGGGSTS